MSPCKCFASACDEPSLEWEVCIICSTKGNVLEIWKCGAGVLLLAQRTTLNGGKCE